MTRQIEMEMVLMMAVCIGAERGGEYPAGVFVHLVQIAAMRAATGELGNAQLRQVLKRGLAPSAALARCTEGHVVERGEMREDEEGKSHGGQANGRMRRGTGRHSWPDRIMGGRQNVG